MAYPARAQSPPEGNPKSHSVSLPRDTFGLFAGDRAEVICLGYAQWTPEPPEYSPRSYNSELPVLVKPPNFPELYVTVLSKEYFDAAFFGELQGAQCIPFESFDPYSYQPTHPGPTILLLGKNPTAHLPVLNQMGIGMFALVASPLLQDDREPRGFKAFVKAPCEMKDVNSLVYGRSGEGDISVAEFDFLRALRYPLKTAVSDPGQLHSRGRRAWFIYQYLQLRNPPICREFAVGDPVSRVQELTPGRWFILRSPSQNNANLTLDGQPFTVPLGDEDRTGYFLPMAPGIKVPSGDVKVYPLERTLQKKA
jgi:hypothetical protein